MAEVDLVSLDRGWQLLLRDADIDPRNALRRAGLSEHLLVDQDAKVTQDDYFNLWNAVAEEAGDPNFPLQIAEALSTEAFSPAVFAWLCCPDLSTATERLAKYKRLIGPMVLEVDEKTDGLFLGIRWTDSSKQVPASLAVTELCITTRLARVATRTRVVPQRVECSHDVDPTGEISKWLGCQITRSNRQGVTFSKEDSRLPFLTMSDTLWATFEPDLRRRLSELDSAATVSKKVRSALLESLPRGEAEVSTVAKNLGMSSRTLQRKLRDEETSFKSLVADTRRDLAHHYLGDPSLPYAEISFLLGFDEPSSFFRAFRDWTGTTPQSMRTQLIAQA